MRQHGTRACYIFGPQPGSDRANGCRCEPCTEANRAYARQRYRQAHRPDETLRPAYTSTHEARRHILWLRTQGVGRRTIADRSGVAFSTIQRIGSGQLTRARPATIDKILAVPRSAARPGAYVPAAPTWALIDDLLEHGWTKVAIARHLTGDPRTLALQLGSDQVTKTNADKVAQLHAEALRPVLRQREIDAERRAHHRRQAAA